MHGNIRCWLWVAKGDASTEDDISLQLGDEPRLAAFFIEGCYFSAIESMLMIALS